MFLCFVFFAQLGMLGCNSERMTEHRAFGIRGSYGEIPEHYNVKGVYTAYNVLHSEGRPNIYLPFTIYLSALKKPIICPPKILDRNRVIYNYKNKVLPHSFEQIIIINTDTDKVWFVKNAFFTKEDIDSKDLKVLSKRVEKIRNIISLHNKGLLKYEQPSSDFIFDTRPTELDAKERYKQVTEAY